MIKKCNLSGLIAENMTLQQLFEDETGNDEAKTQRLSDVNAA